MSTFPYPSRCTNPDSSRTFTENDPPENCPDCQSAVNLLLGQESIAFRTRGKKQA